MYICIYVCCYSSRLVVYVPSINRLLLLLLLYSSYKPIGPQPYPVIYGVFNPVRCHKEVPRSTGHIMMTTRYSDQQGSKSRQTVMRLYEQWHRTISKRFIKPPYFISRAASIDSDCCRLPTTSVLSNKADELQTTLQPVLINKFKFLKVTHRTNTREIEIPRSMVVATLRSQRASQRPALQCPVHP